MVKFQIKQKMHTPQGEQWLEVDIHLAQNDFVSFFGPSGAGKTTVLRVLAGLAMPQEGYIEVDGEIWLDSRRGINRSVQERKVGFVSQDNSLFPHMTIRQNLEYACRSKEDFNTVEEWMAVMGLKGLETQRPAQLSGGQKQRAALVRALLCKPQILLLDEPLSDLDALSRLTLQDEIIKIYQKTKLTTILVSHELPEVFKLSKKVFVIDNGRIIKSGTPQEVFVNSDLSGKFQFTGEILEIQKEGVLNILTLNIGNHITKVIASDEELVDLSVGSKIIVAAKAFNPIILKVKTT